MPKCEKCKHRQFEREESLFSFLRNYYALNLFELNLRFFFILHKNSARNNLIRSKNGFISL